MMGATSGIGSWGRVLGPLLAGANLTLFGYGAAWLGVAFIAALYFAWALRENQPDTPRGGRRTGEAS